MTNTIGYSDTCFRLTFSLSKNDLPYANNEGRKKDIGILLSDSSYPMASTNSFKGIDGNDFINYDSIKVSKVKKTKEENFRTRNRFIIARNVLGKAISLDKKNVNIISKIVSIVWRKNEVKLHDYFEYLSLLESNWYKCCRGGPNVKCTSLRPYDQFDWNMRYFLMCATSYRNNKPTNQKLHISITYPLKQKFRISKDIKIERTKHKKIKINDFEGFRIKNCLFDNNFEIFTEDIFFNM